MKAVGIERATLRLREASRHLDKLEALASGLDVPAFEYEWFLAISAINSAHEILRTTAWKSPTSKQWFSSIDKHIIRKDELLRFILHARGADHHGLSTGTAPQVRGAEYLGYVDQGPILSLNIKIGDGSLVNQDMGGAIILSGNPSQFTFEYKLCEVTDDRDGTRYSPPTMHMGQSVANCTPVAVGRAAVAYYKSILSQATKFVC